MSPTPTNKVLYNKVLEEGRQKFDVWPSAYGSAWLVKTYKKRGGTYSGSKGPVKKSPKKPRRKSPKKSKRKTPKKSKRKSVRKSKRKSVRKSKRKLR